jgi:hypothetical protein
VNARRAYDVIQNNFFLVDSINNAGQKLKLINAPAGIIGISSTSVFGLLTLLIDFFFVACLTACFN